MKGLSKRQAAALAVLRSARTRAGVYAGVDVAELANALDTSPEGAVRTVSSLVRRGLAARYITTLGGRHVMYAAEPGAADRRGAEGRSR